MRTPALAAGTRQLREYAGALGVVAGILLVFLPAVAQRGVYFYGDASAYLPRLAWAGQELRAGRLPQWIPFLSMGTPATLGFYPIDLALFTLLPKEWAYNWDVVFHLILAAASMWALGRAWGQSDLGASLAAIAYALGGFTLGHLQHLNILIAVSWLPLTFLAVDGLFVRPSFRRACALAVVQGLDLLGGHVQIVLYTWMGVFAFVCFRAWSACRLGRTEGACSSVLLSFAALAGALGLSGVFLLPFLEWSRFVTVGQLFSPGYAMTLARFVRLVAPFWFGGSRWRAVSGEDDLVEYSPYVGLLPLVLALIVALRPKGKQTFLVGLALGAVALSLGRSTPLWALIGRWPVLGWGRTPARFLVFLEFALSLLAGFGLDVAASTVRVTRLAAMVLGGLGLCLAGLCAFRSCGVLAVLGSCRAFGFGADTAALLFTLAGSAGALWLLASPASSPRSRVLSLILVGADLFFFEASLSFNDLAPKDSYALSTTAHMILSEGGGTSLFFGVDDARRDRLRDEGRDDQVYRLLLRELMGGALPLSFGVRSFWGSGGLESPRLIRFKSLLEPFRPPTVHTLAVFGGRYVVSRRVLKGFGLTLLHEGRVRLYRNEAALPRAYFAAADKVVASPAAALSAVLQEGFDPRSTVILEAPELEALPERRGSATVRIVRSDADSVGVDVESTTNGWLVLNDAFAPGWEATLDGRPTVIHRANFLVRAVQLSSGKHFVEFRYKPLSRRLGGLVSFGSLVALGLGTLIGGRREPQPEMPNEVSVAA